MESLQIAQILADLSSLQNTDPAAARALLDANKTLSPHTIRHKSEAATLPTPPKFDNLGRRVVVQQKTALKMSRMNSNMSATSGMSVGSANMGDAAFDSASASGLESPDETDPEMKRARTLLELFEKRPLFKEMGDTGLMRAKERVDAVVAKYAKKDLEERQRMARSRHLSPR